MTLKSKKNTNIFNLKFKDIGELYMHWLLLTQPFTKLTYKEMQALACILKYRDKLSKVINDEGLLYANLFSGETRKEIREEIGASITYFQVILTSLRKAGILSPNNRINRKYIPSIEPNCKNYMLVFNISKDEDNSGDDNQRSI